MLHRVSQKKKKLKQTTATKTEDCTNQKFVSGAGERAQWLIMLAVLNKKESVPSNHAK